MIQSGNAYCHDIYFIREGGVAVFEPTCYSETILIYEKGTVLNVYQVLMNVSLEIAFRAFDTKNEKQIDTMTISRENFLEACAKFPQSADLVQEHCIE